MSILLDDVGEEGFNGEIIILGLGLFGFFLHVGILLPFHLLKFSVKGRYHLVNGLLFLWVGIFLHF